MTAADAAVANIKAYIESELGRLLPPDRFNVLDAVADIVAELIEVEEE